MDKNLQIVGALAKAFTQAVDHMLQDDLAAEDAFLENITPEEDVIRLRITMKEPDENGYIALAETYAAVLSRAGYQDMLKKLVPGPAKTDVTRDALKGKAPIFSGLCRREPSFR